MEEVGLLRMLAACSIRAEYLPEPAGIAGMGRNHTRCFQDVPD